MGRMVSYVRRRKLVAAGSCRCLRLARFSARRGQTNASNERGLMCFGNSIKVRSNLRQGLMLPTKAEVAWAAVRVSRKRMRLHGLKPKLLGRLMICAIVDRGFGLNRS